MVAHGAEPMYRSAQSGAPEQREELGSGRSLSKAVTLFKKPMRGRERHTRKDNTPSTSPAGIEFLITPTGSATGNSVVEHTLIANPCGLKGPLAANIVRNNVFVATATEICP